MKWNRVELNLLTPILEQVSADLAPLDGRKVLVLCSATGEVAFWLAEMMETGSVTGLELDPGALAQSLTTSHELGLDASVSFMAAQMEQISFPAESFDALVSEFIVYPSSAPTHIGQGEMARVLRPGGRLILTDVIATKPLPPLVRRALNDIGLDYVCEATQDSFRQWMKQAGLVNIHIADLTPTLRRVWENRRQSASSQHQPGYSLLLDDPRYGLGRGIFYIYARGEKLAQPSGYNHAEK